MTRFDNRQILKGQRELLRAAKAAVGRQSSVERAGKASAATPSASKVLSSETPDRVAVRMDLINRKDPSALERLIGTRDIVSTNFFEKGLQAAKAVCRIKTLGMAGSPSDYATGFLAAPTLLVTNNHVLPDRRSQAEVWRSLGTNSTLISSSDVAASSRSRRSTPSTRVSTSTLPSSPSHPWHTMGRL